MSRFIINCCTDSNDDFPVIEMEDVPEHCPICGAPVSLDNVLEEHAVTVDEAGV